MDPDAVRARMIELANLVLAEEQTQTNSASVELAEAVHDLDTWLRSGGFFPDVWTQRHDHQAYRKQDVDV